MRKPSVGKLRKTNFTVDEEDDDQNSNIGGYRNGKSPSPNITAVGRSSPQKMALNTQNKFINKKLDAITTTRSFFDHNKLYVKSIQDY